MSVYAFQRSKYSARMLLRSFRCSSSASTAVLVNSTHIFSSSSAPACCQRQQHAHNIYQFTQSFPITTRTALIGAHTSAKAQQPPLIQSTPVQNQTHSRVTIIPQNCYSHRQRDSASCNSNPNSTITPNPNMI